MNRAWALCALACVACSPAPREFHALADAFDHYRRAPDSARSAATDALDALRCTDDEVCAAKSACLAAARPTAQASALKAEVRASVARFDAGTLSASDPVALALPGKVEQASRLLAQGHAALPDCEARLATLRLKYGP